MKTRYYLTKYNEIVTSKDVVKAWCLLTGKIIDNEDDEFEIAMKNMKAISAVIDPTYETLIKHNSEVLAVAKYREDNNCSLKEAKEAIDKLKFDIECNNLNLS